eukprot:1774790-Pleurochrysis_carterae.AAC.2
MRIALDYFSRNRTAAGEVSSKPGSAHGRRVIQQSSARRREPKLSFANIQLGHVLSVAPDVTFEGRRI